MMPSSCQRILFSFFAIAAVALISAQAQTASASRPRIALETVTGSQPLRDGIEVQAGTASLRITALRDDILRVRVAPGGALPEDASWAVLPAPRTKSVDVQPSGDVSSVGFRTASLDVRVERSPLRLVVRDLSGNIISADAVGRAATFDLGGFSVSKSMPTEEHYFGLGDKTGSFDRRNQSFTLWNTDVGFQESIDPIYKSIPFFIGINGGRSYGLFLDNTWRTWFDFGKQSRDSYSFGSEGIRVARLLAEVEPGAPGVVEEEPIAAAAVDTDEEGDALINRIDGFLEAHVSIPECEGLISAVEGAGFVPEAEVMLFGGDALGDGETAESECSGATDSVGGNYVAAEVANDEAERRALNADVKRRGTEADRGNISARLHVDGLSARCRKDCP